MKIKKKQLWSLDYTLAEFILPRLIAFKEMKRYGYQGNSKKKWEKKLDDMIFAFDFFLNEHESDFYVRWNIIDPYRKTPDNHSYMRKYSLPNGNIQVTFGENQDLLNGAVLIEEKDHYQDIEQARKYYKRSQKGFELFGKYFRQLWD